MNRLLITALWLVFSSILHAQTAENIRKNADWNGYAQIRFSTNIDDNYNFSLRRLKFRLKSTPDFSEHWSYKIQTTLSSFKNETFFLQDVKLGYKTNGIWSFDIGQFVPQYSLQRFQSDYKLPLIERAKAIDYLIPDGTLGARDIGIQVTAGTKNNLFQSHFGIFNGYGIKEFRLTQNKGILFTHKTSLNLVLSEGTIETGYSVMFRKADNLKIPKVLPDTVLYSGNDFRYNLFLLFKNKFFEIQAEYLSAYIDNRLAEGWYFMSSVNLNKHQIVFAYENYKGLISEIEYLPYFHLGYNYLINKYKAKIFFDNYFQIKENKIQDYTAAIQLQLFLKQK